MKSVIVHAVLAVFGLVFAYQTWARKPEEVALPGMVEIAQCDAAQLQKLQLRTPTLEVSVERAAVDGDATFWFTTQPKTEAKEGKPPAPTPVDTKPKRFLANAAFGDYVKHLGPLRALRSLGKLEAARDADFGFDKSGTHLTITCAGRELSLDGGERAFGASQRYVRDPKTQTAYLVDDKLLADLESAQFKFMQAELHDFHAEDIEDAKVTAHGATRRLLHRDRKLRDQALWVDEQAPQMRNELYNNWFAKLGRLRARAYLPAGAEPGSDLPHQASSSEQVLEIAYRLAERPNPTGKLQIVRVESGGNPFYYARTETTRAWVSLFESSTKDIEQDAGLVVGVEQPPAKPAPVARPERAIPALAPGQSLPPGHPPPPAAGP